MSKKIYQQANETSKVNRELYEDLLIPNLSIEDS